LVKIKRYKGLKHKYGGLGFKEASARYSERRVKKIIYKSAGPKGHLFNRNIYFGLPAWNALCRRSFDLIYIEFMSPGSRVFYVSKMEYFQTCITGWKLDALIRIIFF
jgi:hypothetical protein